MHRGIEVGALHLKVGRGSPCHHHVENKWKTCEMIWRGQCAILACLCHVLFIVLFFPSTMEEYEFLVF